MMKCPGQDRRYWRFEDICLIKCPKCGRVLEFFKDEPRQRCRTCGEVVFNPRKDFSCAVWCPFAEQCLGLKASYFKEGVMGAIKGTRTERNLLTAFAGESQARNRYTFFASKAKKEGHQAIAAVFLETAENEKEHAERLFSFLEGGDVEVQASYPAGVVGTTLENLKSAAAGENYENTKMYPEFAAVAREEGFEEIAKVLESIAVAERFHEMRFLQLARRLEEGTLYKSDRPVKWRCTNCGYIHEGTEAPERCPACDHPRGYYIIQEG